jgi:hypothetical protein
LRRLSIRLLPRQSGIRNVARSAICTTGPSSTRGDASVPAGPTVDRTHSRDAAIHLA